MEKSIEERAKANGECDSENFNWATGTQQESKASAYVKPAKLPTKEEAKARKFIKSNSDPIEVIHVNRLGTVAVRKPKPQEFYRSHEQMFSEVSLIQIDDSYYLVHPDLSAELGEEVRSAYLAAAINSDGALFLWPILKPKADGAGIQFFEQALEDLALSRSTWVRRRWDKGAKSYKIARAQSDREPEWPDNLDICDWVEKAFKGAFIDDVEHPVIRKLRGEFA